MSMSKAVSRRGIRGGQLSCSGKRNQSAGVIGFNTVPVDETCGPQIPVGVTLECLTYNSLWNGNFRRIITSYVLTPLEICSSTSSDKRIGLLLRLIGNHSQRHAFSSDGKNSVRTVNLWQAPERRQTRESEDAVEIYTHDWSCLSFSHLWFNHFEGALGHG